MNPFTKFSKLTKSEQSEILSDPSFKRYAEKIKIEDWPFRKIKKGKFAGQWCTAMAFQKK